MPKVPASDVSTHSRARKWHENLSQRLKIVPKMSWNCPTHLNSFKGHQVSFPYGVLLQSSWGFLQFRPHVRLHASFGRFFILPSTRLNVFIVHVGRAGMTQKYVLDIQHRLLDFRIINICWSMGLDSWPMSLMLLYFHAFQQTKSALWTLPLTFRQAQFYFCHEVWVKCKIEHWICEILFCMMLDDQL